MKERDLPGDQGTRVRIRTYHGRGGFQQIYRALAILIDFDAAAPLFSFGIMILNFDSFICNSKAEGFLVGFQAVMAGGTIDDCGIRPV